MRHSSQTLLSPDCIVIKESRWKQTDIDHHVGPMLNIQFVYVYPVGNWNTFMFVSQRNKYDFEWNTALNACIDLTNNARLDLHLLH